MGWLLQKNDFVYKREKLNMGMRKDRKGRKKEPELQIGFIGFVLWLVLSGKNFCSLLTYANNAQKCLDFTHTSFEMRTLDSVYKLKSYEFELHSLFFFLTCLCVWVLVGLFVCYISSVFCLIFSLFYWLLLPRQLFTHIRTQNASPTHFNCYDFFLTFRGEKKNIRRRLKSYTNKLNWIYFSSAMNLNNEINLDAFSFSLVRSLFLFW